MGNPWDLDWGNQSPQDAAGGMPWDRDWSKPESAKKPDPVGDTVKGFKRAFAQVPELAYGTAALASMSAEHLFGEGGLSTSAKDYFTEKYTARQAANEKYAPSVEFTDAWDNLKNGDVGSMADWLQDSAGYVVGQGLQTLATGGVGAILGKAGLSAATQKMLGGVVAKQAAKIAEESATKQGLTDLARESAIRAMMPEATKLAAQRTAQVIGAGVALNAQNLGMEAGDIFGGLTQEAEKSGKAITGDDLLRAWGAAAAAAGTETATDLLGLGAITGRIKIGGKSMQSMPGVGGRAARAAGAVAVGAPLEAGQEYVQTALEQFGAGQPLNTDEAGKERINAAAVGGLGGTIVGGTAGIISRARENQEARDIAKTIDTVTSAPTVDAAIAAAMATSDGIAYDAGAAQAGLIAAKFQGDRTAELRAQGIEPLPGSEIPAVPGAPTPDTTKDLPELTTGARTQEQQLWMTGEIGKQGVAKEAELDTLQRDSRLPAALYDAEQARIQAETPVPAQPPTAMELAFQKARGDNPSDGISQRNVSVDSGVRQGGAESSVIAESPGQTSKAGESTGAGVAGRSIEAAQSQAPTVDQAAHDAATSSRNDLPEPTDAQKEAGNYPKGHIAVAGLDISVENPAGSKRRPEWPTLEAHYGYVKGVPARAPDKEHVDVFVKEGTPEDHAGPVFVIDQNHANGKFDEPKAMIGYSSQDKATAAYLKNYTKGWESRVRGVAALTTEQFKQRLNDPQGFAQPQPEGQPLPQSIDPPGGAKLTESTAAPELPQNSEQTPPTSERAQEPAAKIGGKPVSDISLPQLRKFAKSKGERIRAMAEAEIARRAAGAEAFRAKAQHDNELYNSPSRKFLRLVNRLGGVKSSGSTLGGARDVLGERTAIKLGGMAVRIFKTDGHGIDYMATLLHEEKWLTNDEYGDVDGGVARVKEMIRDAVDDKLQPVLEADVQAQFERDAEQKALAEEARAAGVELTPQDVDFFGLVADAAEQDYAAVEAFKQQYMDSSVEEANDALQELIDGRDQQNEVADRAGPESGQAATRQEEGPAEAANPATAGTAAEVARPALALQAQTPEEARAEAERIADAKAAEAKAVADAARDERNAANKAERDRRAAEVLAEREAAKKAEIDAARETFELGQEAPAPVVKKVTTEEAAGQGDLLSQPANTLSPADLLRAAAAKMDEAAKPAVETKPANEETPAPKAETPAGIEDFGKQITGARKDYAAAFRDRMAEAADIDIAAEPLSKSWPEPDYQKLLDDGADTWAVAFMHAARDEIPTKPQQSWKLKKWVDQVKLLREFASGLTNGNMDVPYVRGVLENNAFLKDVSGRVELYMEVGHDKSLKGVRIRNGSYGIYESVKYDPPKIIWTVEGKVKSSKFSRWPTTYATGDTRAQAIENFKKKWSEATAKPDEKGIDFDIYSRRGTGKFFIGKKVGKEVVTLKDDFATAKEARQWKADNQAELVKMLERLKDVPNERRENNSPRVGEDHRNGANVTPEQFKDTFGFRGGQFGNTMPQSERQSNLNEAYDALMDLAGVIGVPPKALSLNGELGLAFGARGRGGKNAPSAHYERDVTGKVSDNNVVINLTRARGAGSLAHEWFHAVDNYFARIRGEKGGMVTLRPYGAGGTIRAEMVVAFNRIMVAVNASALRARSQKLDQTRSKPYWSTGHEMAARSFESYVVAKLQDQSASNDYLANIVSQEYWDAAAALGIEKDNTYPYPAAAEIPAIRAAFDDFFQTVKTKETDSGVAMFSRAPLTSNDTQATAALKLLAENDELFQYPRSERKDLGGIARDVDPDLTVSDVTSIEGPSRGTKVAKVFAIRDPDMNMAEVTQTSDGIVWLNILGWEQGKGGAAIYSIVANYAYNNGLVFEGDPYGLSDVAMRRRLENMLSSALKFGTTKHLRPHEKQLEGDPKIGISPLSWEDGNDTFNLRQMMTTAYHNLRSKVPEIANVTYDFDRNTFEADGKTVGDKFFVELAQSIGAREARAGRATLKRAALFNTLVREESGEGWRRVLGEILRQSRNELDPQLRETFYSRNPAAAGVSASQVRATLAPILARWKNAPNIEVVQSIQDAPAAVRDEDARQRSQGATGEVEGVWHAGTVYLFADSLSSLDRAATVVFHEALGHYGLRGVFGDRLNGVLNGIVAERRPDVARKAEQYGLDMANEADRLTAAAEVLAELAQTRPEISFVRRAIAIIRQFLRGIGVKMRLSDNDVIANYIIPARNFVERGKTKAVAQGQLEPAYARSGQTDTEAFLKWFGDSKVVDAEGKPLVVYHGTGHDVSPHFMGDEMAGWFSEDPRIANDRYAYERDDSEAGPHVIPSFLAITKPLDLTGKFDMDDTMSGADVYREAGIKPLVMRESLDQGGPAHEAVNDRSFVAAAVAAGYDGIKVKEDGVTTWAAFKPEQIKSAIGNRGTFDAENKDIRFSRAVTPEWITSGPVALQQAASKIDTFAPSETIGEKIKGLTVNWQKRLVQGLFDAYAPLKDLSRKAYVHARMTKSADGVLEGMLLYGKPKMDADGAIVGDLDGKGFLGAMKELKGEHDRFFMWVAGNRASRLADEGRENLFTADEIAAMKTLNQGQMKDGSSRQTAFLKAQNELRDYNKAVMDIAEATGLIDGDARHLWEHDFYIPFYRVMEDDKLSGPGKIKGLVRQQAFKKLKGGQENLGDLMANTLRNWSHLLSASLANQAAVNSLEAAESAGVATKTSSETKGATFAMVDGKQVYYEVDDPFVMQAISAIESVTFKGLPMKLMSKFKHYLTLGVTASPTFRIRNLMRDTIAAIAQNDVSYNALNNVVEGFKGTNKKSADYTSMLFGGGMVRFGTYLEDDRAEHARRLIDAGVEDQTILNSPQKIKAALAKLWDSYQDFGDRMENINRSALYKQYIAQGKSHLEASFRARDMMDFSMQGSWVAVRFLNQVVPFLNARMQGLYKLGRAAKEDPKRLGYVSAGVALASIALLLAYEDDEDWKKREDWDRDTYWWFKIGDQAYRIPKPFEIGAIGTLAERGAELMISDEMTGERFGERMRAMISQTFAMNPVPQMFKPMLDIYANIDSFTGRQIETRGMERLSKSERSTAQTSLIANLFGAAGDYTGLSPIQVDHLIRGYFGWLGSHTAMTIDLMAQPFTEGGDKPAKRIGDMFVVGDFVKDLPSDQSRYVEQFYKQAKAVSEVMADIKHARDVGDIERARAIIEDNHDKVAMHKLFSRAERKMGEINKAIRLTNGRSGLSGEEKRARLDQLTAMRNQLAKTVSDRAVALRQ